MYLSDGKHFQISCENNGSVLGCNMDITMASDGRANSNRRLGRICSECSSQLLVPRLMLMPFVNSTFKNFL